MENQISSVTKQYFMFFDETNMPIAVFLTTTEENAQKFFKILYRDSWEQSLAKGISCMREIDVLPDELERIHQEYVSREKAKNKALASVLATKPVLKKDWVADIPNQISNVTLETSRYLKP
jgi:hypothetical protein